jgi:hypothetical protein
VFKTICSPANEEEWVLYIVQQIVKMNFGNVYFCKRESKGKSHQPLQIVELRPRNSVFVK